MRARVMKSSDRRETQALRRFLVSARYSLRLRLLALVFFVVVGSIFLTALFALKQAEKVFVVQLEHEALLLSDTLEAAITPFLAGEPDVQALQRHIDRVAAARDKNDIEINIMLRRGFRSSIVASNIPDNVERTSVYEHRDMLAALEKREPVVFVGRDDDSVATQPVSRRSPDFYIRPGERFVSITTPLVVDGQGLGSINTKLSLAEIDRKLGEIRGGIWMMGFLLPAAAFVLVLAAVQGGLRPLKRLAAEVAGVDSSRLSSRFSTEARPPELRSIIVRLNELLERLEAAFRRERQFTAHVAHELRTPITTLKTICEVGLQESSVADWKGAGLPLLQDALAVCEQMAHLIEGLLRLVRCESGLQEVDITAWELNPLVEDAWKDFERRAVEKELDVEFDLAGPAPVHSDRVLFGAVLRNLFANAVTYTNRNGSIRCTLQKEETGFLLSLANTSNGLTERDMERLFQPFWRKDEARSESSHCGLGLSLVQSYARLLNIRVTADLPTPDRLRITLRIPASAQ